MKIMAGCKNKKQCIGMDCHHSRRHVFIAEECNEINSECGCIPCRPIRQRKVAKQATNNRSDEIAWLIDTISSANELMDEVNKVCLFEQAINNRIAKLRGLLKEQQSNEHEKS